MCSKTWKLVYLNKSPAHHFFFLLFRLWFPKIKYKKIPIVGKFCLVGRYYYCHSIQLLLVAQCPNQVENYACCTFKYCFHPDLCRLLSGQPSKASCSLSLECAQPLPPASTNVSADQFSGFESFEGNG